jgi:hypothetical protein
VNNAAACRRLRRQAKQVMGATGSLLGDGAGRMPFEILAAQPLGKIVHKAAVGSNGSSMVGRKKPDRILIGRVTCR